MRSTPISKIPAAAVWLAAAMLLSGPANAMAQSPGFVVPVGVSTEQDGTIRVTATTGTAQGLEYLSIRYSPDGELIEQIHYGEPDGDQVAVSGNSDGASGHYIVGFSVPPDGESEPLIIKYESVSGAATEERVASHSFQVDPNPVTSSARIRFRLRHACHTIVEVHDATGRHVTTISDQHRQAGQHQLQWSTSELPAGFYTVVLTATGHTGRVSIPVNVVLLDGQ